MSAQAVTTGQSGASDQPNGVVRPQQGNGHQNAETLGVFLDAAAAPLQTAEHEEIKHEDQRREQTRDSELLGGPAGSSDRQQTAANAYDGYEMRSGEVDLAGRFSQERQTGVQIGPQGPVDEVNLAEQTVGVDPGGSIPLSGGGGIQADYHTPRSSMSAGISGFGAACSGAQGQWPGWVTRLGDLFKAPPIPGTWLPSPIPSPPVRQHADLTARQPMMYGRPAQPADGGRVFPKGRSGYLNNTPSSSSIPAEAIQAEVQRQMGDLLTRLAEVESDNARLQLELSEEKRKACGDVHQRTAVQHDVPERDPGLQSVRASEHRGDPGELSRQPENRGESWSKIWEGLTAKLPSRPQVGAARGSTSGLPSVLEAKPEPKAASSGDLRRDGGAGSLEGLGVIEALAQSMRQIQDLQVKALSKGDDDIGSPEAVKTAVTTLPTLGLPEGDQCGLVFQDWIIQITTAMQDLSTSSGTWWEGVKTIVVQAYSQWLGATPLERLGIEPTGSPELVAGKYLRINARACAMVVQAIPEAIKTDLIARRATQSMPLMMFRLYTLYQPGGAGERSVILQRLQGGDRPTTTEECLKQLRSWPRWLQRCQDMGMSVPDGTVLAKGLTNLANGAITQVPDAMFRTQLVRATLRIDQQPSLSDVLKYQQHLQAEVENIAASASALPTSPSVRALTATGGASQQSTSGKSPCRYFIKASGCRRGAKCPYAHDLTSLTKSERAKKCLACGAEDHRQRECPTKSGVPQRGRAAAGGSDTPKAGDQRARNAVEPESETSPKAVASIETAQGQPLTWEAILQAAAKVAGVPPEAKAPSLHVIAIHAVGEQENENVEAYALVDSGATHPLRRASSIEEWDASSVVVVHLAGGEVVELKMNKAGTLLVPIGGSTRTTSTAPIVPLGSLVGVLGYRMEWQGSRCRLIGKEGDVLTLRVRDGCPEITEQQALSLIARIEEKKLADLRAATAVTKEKIREAAISLDKTWFDHLIA